MWTFRGVPFLIDDKLNIIAIPYCANILQLMWLIRALRTNYEIILSGENVVTISLLPDFILIFFFIVATATECVVWNFGFASGRWLFFFFFWLLYKFVTVGHCQNVWQDTVYGWFFSVYVFRMLKSYFDTTSSFDKEFTHRQEGEKKMKCKRFALCIYIHITLVTSHSKCFHSMIRNRPSFVCCERNIVSVESNRGVSSVTNEQKPTYCGTKDHEKNKNERKKKRID